MSDDHHLRFVNARVNPEERPDDERSTLASTDPGLRDQRLMLFGLFIHIYNIRDGNSLKFGGMIPSKTIFNAL